MAGEPASYEIHRDGYFLIEIFYKLWYSIKSILVLIKLWRSYMIFFIIALLCTYSFSLGTPTDHSLKRPLSWEDSFEEFESTPSSPQRRRITPTPLGTPVGAHTTPTPPANGIDPFGSNMPLVSPVITRQTPVQSETDQEFVEFMATLEALRETPREVGVPTSPSHGSPSTTRMPETGTPPPHNPGRVSGPTQLPINPRVRRLVFDSE